MTKTQSHRKIIAIDGSILQCAKSCLNGVDVEPDVYYILTNYGIKKGYHKDYDNETIDKFYKLVTKEIVKL